MPADGLLHLSAFVSVITSGYVGWDKLAEALPASKRLHRTQTRYFQSVVSSIDPEGKDGHVPPELDRHWEYYFLCILAGYEEVVRIPDDVWGVLKGKLSRYAPLYHFVNGEVDRIHVGVLAAVSVFSFFLLSICTQFISVEHFVSGINISATGVLIGFVILSGASAPCFRVVRRWARLFSFCKKRSHRVRLLRVVLLALSVFLAFCLSRLNVFLALNEYFPFSLSFVQSLCLFYVCASLCVFFLVYCSFRIMSVGRHSRDFAAVLYRVISNVAGDKVKKNVDEEMKRVLEEIQKLNGL